jgi:hypothetical protein
MAVNSISASGRWTLLEITSMAKGFGRKGSQDIPKRVGRRSQRREFFTSPHAPRLLRRPMLIPAASWAMAVIFP